MEKLLTTKLYIPRTRPDLVPRPRLIERLNEGLHRKLTLICAPAGFGKTTLISEWVAGCKRPVAWLSLDEGDNDPIRFHAYLVAALQTIEAGIFENVQAMLRISQPPPIESVLTELINEVVTLSQDFVLVLDDYQVIEDRSIDESLTFLLDHIPPVMHLVIISRSDPMLPLSRLRARSQMTELRIGDLRFSTHEATDFLNRVMGLVLSEEDIAALETRTEGWISGLRLAAISMRGRENVHEFVATFSGSHHYVIDYLVDEVLALQPEDIQLFLIQTSILERFNSALCDAVLEGSNSREILQKLDEANLFLIPLDDERIWYRYHHLFADFLKQRLVEKNPGVIPLLHGRAVGWLEQNGLINEAIDHSLDGEDFQHAAQLIESISPDMMMQNEFDQLEKWLDAIPQELVETWPWLCIIRAWMNQRWARLDEAEQYIIYAEQALEAETIQKPVEGANVIRGQAAAIRALVALNKTRIPQAIEFANHALNLLPVGHFNRAISMLVLGMAKGANGEYVEANQILVEAYRDSLNVGNLTQAQNILLENGILLEKQGRLHQALETYEEAVQLTYSKTEIKLPHASFASVFMGNIYREWNELDAALRHVKEGIEIGLPFKMVDAVATGYAVITRIHLALDDLESAIEASLIAGRYVRELPGLEPITITQIWDSEARVKFAQKKIDEAASLFLENNPCDVYDINCFGEFEQIIWARILLYRGRECKNVSDLLKAHHLINQMLELTKDLGLTSKTIELLVLNSLVLIEIETMDGALDALAEALWLAETGSYMRVFIDEGDSMKALLREAETRGIAPDYVSKLLAGFETDRVPVEITSVHSLIEPLSEREIEVLRLLKTELSGPDIADVLMIALSTLRTHTQNIYGKLGVSNRRAAVRKAEELNLR